MTVALIFKCFNSRAMDVIWIANMFSGLRKKTGCDKSELVFFT